MKTITLSKENISGVYKKQEGRGRQGLYLDLRDLDGAPDQRVYWGSTFPNPEEHWGLYTYDETFAKLDDDGNEIEGEYVDGSGNDVDADRIFPTIFEGIVAMVSGDEVEVKDYEGEEADEDADENEE